MAQAAFDPEILGRSSLGGELYLNGDPNKLNQNGEHFIAFSEIAGQNLEKKVAVVRSINELSDKTEQTIQRIRNSRFPSVDWMFSHAACTVSGKNGNLGYHADNYCVCIIQIKGERQWKVWSQETLTPLEKRFLHRERHNEHGFLPTVSDEPPLLEISLKEGEYLWIPALFPHCGFTESIQNSISVSLVWSIPSTLKLFYLVREALSLNISTVEAESKVPNLYEHIWSDNTSAVETIEESIEEIANHLDLQYDQDIIQKIAANYVEERTQKS